MARPASRGRRARAVTAPPRRLRGLPGAPAGSLRPRTGLPRLRALLPAALLAAAALALPAPASADVLVSTVGQTAAAGGGRVWANRWHAQAFTTGSHTAGYTLTSIEARTNQSEAAPGELRAQLWSDVTGNPGAKLADLTVPATITASGATPANIVFAAPAGTRLAANTTYYFVIGGAASRSPATNMQFQILNTASDNEDSGAAAGWSVDDTSRFGAGSGGNPPSGWSTWTETRLIRVNGSARGAALSTNANLSALTAKSATSGTGTFSALALSPATFAKATLAYTATVANGITHVKLTPTVEATGKATLKVGKGTSLTAVASGTESSAIALSEGANAIKVEVTAEDGTTKRTYTVTVTRSASTTPATPQVSFASTTYSVNEGASVTLTVNISPALTAASRVAVLATTPSSANPPEDYTFGGLTGRAGSRMLALPANATTATFTLAAVADGTTEGAETATWFLQKVTGEPYTVVRASEKATITIADTSTAAPASANALVSNLGQTTFTTTLAIGSNPVAQKFTTGSAAAGYTLASIEIDFAAAVGTPANLRAELWSATGAGAPDQKLAGLTVPSTVGVGAAAFDAPPNTSLDASTSYFAVVYESGATTGSLRTTRTNNEDTGSASGWSIGDTRHGRSGTSWRTNTIELKIRVNGAVKGATQSTDASLSALTAKSAASATGTFSALALSPSTFSASTTAYTASVANTVTHVKLTPTKAHTGASIKVGKGTSLTAVTSGTESTAIALGAAGTDTAIKVEVTAQDGTTKRTYTVTVTRALAVPTGVTVTAHLDKIETTWTAVQGAGSYTIYVERVSTGVLSFWGQVAPYTGAGLPEEAGFIIAPGEKYRVRIRACPTGDWRLTATGCSAQTTAVTATTPSSSPATPANFVATAGDDRIDVNWEASAGATAGYEIGIGKVSEGGFPSSWAVTSATATSSFLTKQGGFAANGVEYQLRIRACKSAVPATNTGKGCSAWSATQTVTPQAASSADARLNGLTAHSSTDGSDFSTALSIGTFVAETESYTASVANSVTHVKLTPRTAHSGASIKVGKGTSLSAVTSGSASDAIALSVGANAIKVEVTAQDGTTKKTYTVTVTRATATQSTDASLSALTAKNHTSATGTFSALALTPSTFSATTTSYTASVANSITHVKLTPTKAHTGASIKVGKGTGLTAVTSGTESSAIALSEGANAIKVEVTAEDGTTKRTYTVTVTRAASGTTPPASTPTVSLSAENDNPVVAEGSAATIVATLSAALGSDVVIPVTVTRGSAEAGDIGTLTSITVSQGFTVGAADITTAQDTDADHETFTVSLGTPLPPSVSAGTPNSVTVTVRDDEATRDSLVGLSLTVGGSAVTLSPAFKTSTTSYTGTVAVSAASASVTPTWIEGHNVETTVASATPDFDSILTQQGSALASSGTSKTVTLAASGATWVSVTVSDDTAETSTTYRVVLNKLAAPSAAPAGLGVTGGDGKLDLSWTAPSGTVSGYTVQYRRSDASSLSVTGDPDTGYADAGHSGTGTAAAITGLTNGVAYTVRVQAVNAAGGGPWAAGTGTPVAAVTAPTALTLEVDARPGEGGAARFITARLNAAAPAGGTAVTLSVGSASTATGSGAGADYTLSATTLTIAAGQTSGRVTLTIVDDAAEESDETLVLSAASTNPALTSNTLTLSIQDNDARNPAVSLSAAPNPVAEGSPVTVRATLSAAKSAAVSVPVTLTAGTAEPGDFGALTSIVIAAGSTSGTGTVTTARDDDTDDETFTVSLGTLPPSVSAGAPDSVTVTILDGEPPADGGAPADGDAPRVYLLADPAFPVEGGTVTVRALLSRRLEADAVIPVTVTAGTAEAGDYGPLSPPSITIPAGKISGTAEIATVRDEDRDDETFTVSLGSPLPPGTVAGRPAAEGPYAGLSGSSEVEIYDRDRLPATAPRDLAAAARDGGLALTWKAPYGPVPSYYTVCWKASAAPDSDAASGDPATGWVCADEIRARSHAISGLVNGTSYDVRVRKVGVADGGGWEYFAWDAVSGVPRAPSGFPGPPGTPGTPGTPGSFGSSGLTLSVDPSALTAGGAVTVTAHLGVPAAGATELWFRAGDDYARWGPSCDYETATSVIIPAGGREAAAQLCALEGAAGRTFAVTAGFPGSLEAVAGVSVPVGGGSPPAALTLSADPALGVEGGVTTVTARLDRPAEHGVVVGFTMIAGTGWARWGPDCESPVPSGGRDVAIPPGGLEASAALCVPAPAPLIVVSAYVEEPYVDGPELVVVDPPPEEDPVRIRVADGEAAEGDAALEFAVTLDRAADALAAVDYATGDGTAAAGQDYEAASGTLLFAPGETRLTVRVAILDDAIDEGVETFVLRLSNPRGEAAPRLETAYATGRIRNSDPMPGAWLARFGRASADHAIGAIGRRLRGGARETHLTLGGQRVEGWLRRDGGGDSGPGARRNPAPAPSARPGGERAGERQPAFGGPAAFGGAPGGAAAFGGAPGGPAAFGGAPGGPAAFGGPAALVGAPAPVGSPAPGGAPAFGGAPAAGPVPGGQFSGGGFGAMLDTAAGAAGDAGWARWYRRGRALLGHGGRAGLRGVLMGSSFHYSPNAGADAKPAGPFGDWAAWGETASSRFGGAAGPLSVEGEAVTALLGADSRGARWRAGVALSFSEGAGAYRHPELKGGAVTSRLASLHPYARFDLNSRAGVWGALGYGAGELSLTPSGADSPIGADLGSRFAAFGGRAALSARAGGAGTFELAVRADARLTDTASEGAPGLIAAHGATGRARVLLEGSGSLRLPGGAELRPTLEAGLRYDTGDAETGAGLEIGAGLGYARGPLEARADVRGLAAHQDAEYREWGFSGSVNYRPGRDGQGLSMRLGSSWGAAHSGVRSLWTAESAAGLGRGGGAMPGSQRHTAEFGYGIAGRAGRALWRPYLAADAGDGSSAVRFGLELDAGAHARFGLEAGRRDSPGGIEPPERAVQLQGRMLW